MFVNRLDEHFGFEPEAGSPPTVGKSPPANLLPRVTLQDIYQAAAESAYRDHELDKLFNAEFYGDHGAGI